MESGKEMKNQRMLDELTELMRIDVSSGQETEIAEHLVKKLEQMGFAITRDEPGRTFGRRVRQYSGGSGRRAGRCCLFLFPYGPCAGRHWNQTGGGGLESFVFGAARFWRRMICPVWQHFRGRASGD